MPCTLYQSEQLSRLSLLRFSALKQDKLFSLSEI